MPKPGPKSRGRPVDAAKQRAVIEAANREFFAHGYAEASIERIAASAGVSKVTIYNRFGGKEALFSASIRAECEAMREALDLDVGAGLPLREVLVRIGERMHVFLNRPHMIRFECRLAIETERDPMVGELFLDAGPRAMRRAIEAVVRSGVEAGTIACSDCAGATMQLAAMLKGFDDIERRFGKVKPLSPQEVRKRAEAAVDAFLRAYAPTDPKAAG